MTKCARFSGGGDNDFVDDVSDKAAFVAVRLLAPLPLVLGLLLLFELVVVVVTSDIIWSKIEFFKTHMFFSLKIDVIIF
jgi:hypothetical protein